MATDSTFCHQQRTITQLYNQPLVRFTPPNPYGLSFTKHQLDMRRKTEILKYSSNKSSAQTNNVTKKEQYAALARRRYPPSSQTNCIPKPMPTSASNVPGPVTYLYSDETVPLYNYSDFNARTYPDYVPPNPDPWQFVTLDNILIYDNGSRNVYYLIIRNTINRPQYNYKIVTPIGLSIAGVVPPASTSAINAFIQLKAASLSVYYNDNLVKAFNASTIANFDISLNIPRNTSSSFAPFSTTNFIGNLMFENVLLYTAPTYVYTFALTVDLALTVTPTNASENTFTYIASLANISPSATYQMIGCTVTLNPFNPGINAGSSLSFIV